MLRKKTSPIGSLMLLLLLVQLACNSLAPQPTPTLALTDTPQPTATITLTPTNTPKPSPTLRPTKTPNLAATERINGFNQETQSYFEKGYLNTTDGTLQEFKDFAHDWAYLNYYDWQPLGVNTENFYISAHLKWESAFRNADTSGCGIVFGLQANGDHYAVFLDRSRILFLNADQTSGYSYEVKLTRGYNTMNFGNPADQPQEADFTVIVKDAYAYVIVNGKAPAEYTLSKSRNLLGDVGLSLLSGTNKDFGTRCTMTNVHLWMEKK